jgi:signal transduction histidine kinase
VQPPSLSGAPRRWRRPLGPLVLFPLTTIALLVGLGWIGFQWLAIDRQNDDRAIEMRIGGATDAIALEIRHNLAAVEAHLDRLAVTAPAALDGATAEAALRLPADSLFVVFDERSVRAAPAQRLIYYPALPALEEPYLPPLVVSRASARVLTDPKAAIELFESLVHNAEPQTVAESLLGLANAQIKMGQFDAALATYARLNRPAPFVAGRPAELLGRIGRADLLVSLGRQLELAEEVRRLDRDLSGGRWQLTRETYLHYSGEATRLAQVARDPTLVSGPTPAAVALAVGVESLWAGWRERGAASGGVGRTTRVIENQLMLILARATTNRFVALVAGPAFVQERILGPSRDVLDVNRARVVLEGAEGLQLSSHDAPPPSARSVDRSMEQAQLPWSLHVNSANPDAERADQARRRRMVVAGLVVLALLIMLGSYLSVRAATREIEAAQLKSDFVAAVSHEFRTPLTLLRQFSDLLADGRVSTDQERRKYYAALQRGTRRLTRLVEDLLDFGRMEAGSRDFALRPMAARPWFMGVTQEFQDEVRNKGYELVVSWDAPDAVMIDAEESAIGRALWNLLDNAVKYSPECQQIWVSAAFENNRFLLRVRDRGIGVSTADQRAIFHKFVRASKSGVGTGLGLAIVEQIVLAHRGEVGIDSAVGEGSTFSISLPAAVQPRAGEQEQVQWRAS